MFLLGVSTLALIAQTYFLGWMTGILAAPASFMAGYCYRQYTRKMPARRLAFLVLKEDLQEGVD